MSWPTGKPRAKDMTGSTFNRLTVIGRAPNRGDDRAYWNCLCSCGESRTVSSNDLRSGHTKSCGCLNLEAAKERATKHGHSKKENGRQSKTYVAWLNMHNRCYKKSANGYASYGGRGIIVCDAWFDFAVFLNDMGESPINMSLERKNVNGNYEPSNCVWATKEIQDNNKRTTVYVEVDGVRMSMSQAANLLNCSAGRVRYAVQRYGTGWLEFVRAAAAIATHKEGA